MAFTSEVQYAWIDPESNYGVLMSVDEVIYFKFDKDSKLVTETSENMFESGIISKANEEQTFLTSDLQGSLQFTQIDLDTMTTQSYDIAATEIETMAMSNDLYGFYAIGDHDYSTEEQLDSGIVQLFRNSDLIGIAVSSDGMSHLGEYVFIGSDYLPHQGGNTTNDGQQVILVASSYASETTRYLNFYKVVTDSVLYLWQSQVAEV